MAEILVGKEGRVFISRLGREDAELSIRILDRVSRDLHLSVPQPQTVRQGIMEHELKPPMKHAFFVALRRLAERHQLLPDRVKMKEKHEISDEIHVSGGFGERRVAVKTGKAFGREDLQKLKKLASARRDEELKKIQKTKKAGINAVLAPT